MNKPLVSVICPMHNCEKFAIETISSVLLQDYENIELLIIDDCSTDKTEQIVKSFNDKRIKFIKNDKNSGAAFSRNVGLRVANGDYIAFLDGDDVWYAQKLEKQIKFMIDNNYLFSYTDYESIEEDGKRTGTYFTGPKIVTHKDFKRIDYIGTSTAIFKKCVYPNLQIPNDIYKRNDDALWLLISSRTPCYRMEGIYSGYRKVSGSISSVKKRKLIKYHVILYKKLYGFSNFRAYFWSLRNIVWYLLKQLKYKKRGIK